MTHARACGQHPGVADVGEHQAPGGDVVAGLAHERVTRRRVEGEKGRVDVQQEPRGIARQPVERGPLGIREKELPLGARACHKRETTFLLHTLHGANLPRREDALVHAAEEDVRKLEALCRVHRHELDLVTLHALVDVGEEGHMAKIVLDRGLLAALALVLEHGLAKLRQVVQPLLAALRAQGPLVPRLVKERGEKLRHRATLATDGVLVDEPHEGTRTRALEEWVVERAAQRLEERDMLPVGELPKEPHAVLADVSLGAVDDARQREVVLIRNHTQV